MKSHFRSGFGEPLKSNLPVNQKELGTPFGSHDPTHSRTCIRYPLAVSSGGVITLSTSSLHQLPLTPLTHLPAINTAARTQIMSGNRI